MESEFLLGIAEYIAGKNIATWSPEAVYPAGRTGIFIGVVPDSPAGLITLTTYPVSDHVSLSSSVLGLQVRLRGASPRITACLDLSNAVFDALHGVQRLHLSTGVLVSQARRQSSASLGQDSARRWSRVDNYYCDVHYPSQYRI